MAADFSKNGIGSAGAGQLCQVLTNNEGLKTLLLDTNALGDEGAAMLAAVSWSVGAGWENGEVGWEALRVAGPRCQGSGRATGGNHPSAFVRQNWALLPPSHLHLDCCCC